MWFAAAAVVAVVAVVLVRRHSANAAPTFDTSGTPGSSSGSSAQQPASGGGNAAGSLPDDLVVHPSDPVTTQVQQTDTTSPESPQAIAPAGNIGTAVSGGPTLLVNGQPATSTTVIGGQGYEQSSPGSDYYVPVPLSEASPTSNIHKPGIQM